MGMYWIAAALAAQVELSVDTAELREGQTVGLTVTLTDGESKVPPTVPVPDGLRIAYQNPQVYEFIINFHRVVNTAWHYQLTALRRGTYTIGPVVVQAGSRTLTTNPVTIRVDPRDSGGGLNTLTAIVPESPVWVGQVVVYGLRFVTDKNLVNGRWIPPEVVGMEREPGVEPEQKRYSLVDGGVVQTVQELWYPLRATKPGEVRIPPGVYQAQFAVERRRDRFRLRSPDDFMDGMVGFNEVRSEVYSSEPRTLTIKPLPPEGRPDDFSGVVGQLEVRAVPSATTARVGDTVTVDVTLSADAPLAGVALPPVELDSVRVYDDQPVVETRFVNGKLESVATAKRAVVPQQAGTLELPPVVVPYFNPVKGTWDEARSEPIRIEVSGVADASQVASFAEGGAREVAALAEDILPVRTNASVRAPIAPAWGWLLSAPAALLLGREGVRALAARRPRRVRRFDFADLPTDRDGRLAGLERLCRERVGARLGIPPEAVDRDALAGLGDHADRAREAWRLLERARFAGEDVDPEPAVRRLCEALG